LNPERPDTGLNDAISNVLRYGVLLSSAVLALGSLLFLVVPPHGAPDSLQSLLALNFGRPTINATSLLQGLADGNAVSILQLGALILLATPIARVMASIFLFFKEKDMLYVYITTLVLAMLLFSIFVVGPIEA
jgi:uncharacterized membrane protein